MKIVIDLPDAVINRAKGKDGHKLCDIDIKYICRQIANCTGLDEIRSQGEWKLINANEYANDVNGDYYINTYACPSCNWEVRTEGEMGYNFCPMCGINLGGEKK